MELDSLDETVLSLAGKPLDDERGHKLRDLPVQVMPNPFEHTDR